MNIVATRPHDPSLFAKGSAGASSRCGLIRSDGPARHGPPVVDVATDRNHGRTGTPIRIWRALCPGCARAQGLDVPPGIRTVSVAAINRCPLRSLAATHYRVDGICQCEAVGS